MGDRPHPESITTPPLPRGFDPVERQRALDDEAIAALFVALGHPEYVARAQAVGVEVLLARIVGFDLIARCDRCGWIASFDPSGLVMSREDGSLQLVQPGPVPQPVLCYRPRPDLAAGHVCCLGHYHPTRSP